MKKIIIASLVLLTTACSAKFAKTGESSFEPLAIGCNFSVYTTNPNKAFDEVGLVEYQPSPVRGYPKSLSDAKDQAADLVCQNGGNALLLWETNGFGQYLKATVIRFK